MNSTVRSLLKKKRQKERTGSQTGGGVSSATNHAVRYTGLFQSNGPFADSNKCKNLPINCSFVDLTENNTDDSDSSATNPAIRYTGNNKNFPITCNVVNLTERRDGSKKVVEAVVIQNVSKTEYIVIEDLSEDDAAAAGISDPKAGYVMLPSYAPGSSGPRKRGGDKGNKTLAAAKKKSSDKQGAPLPKIDKCWSLSVTQSEAAPPSNRPVPSLSVAPPEPCASSVDEFELNVEEDCLLMYEAPSGAPSKGIPETYICKHCPYETRMQSDLLFHTVVTHPEHEPPSFPVAPEERPGDDEELPILKSMLTSPPGGGSTLRPVTWSNSPGSFEDEYINSIVSGKLNSIPFKNYFVGCNKKK